MKFMTLHGFYFEIDQHLIKLHKELNIIGLTLMSDFKSVLIQFYSYGKNWLMTLI